MPNFSVDELTRITADIFAAAGAPRDHAETVAVALVGANAAGHDSHGVIRIPQYLDWVNKGDLDPAATMSIERETPILAVANGNWGFGQIVGVQAMEVGIDKVRVSGLASVALKNANHLGRIGDYATMAAREGFISMIFINAHGGGRLVAPWGGLERRLSANPLAVGIPRGDADPIILDMSTCVVAEGKVRVAKHKGDSLPEGCIIDSEGNPSVDPNDFYGPPQGALLPIGKHKGYGLGIIVDILAGAVTSAGCTNPDIDRIGNGTFMILIDPVQFTAREDFEAETSRFVEYVKSARLAPGVEEILMPGDPETLTTRQRSRDGIDVPEETWAQIRRAVAHLDVEIP
jgi:uncharacterized oxidoreductase